MSRLKNIWAWVVALFAERDAVDAVEIKAESRKKRAKRQKIDNWVPGDYATAGDLLGDLEDRYEWLRGFKPKMSDDGLRAIKKFGVYIYPTNTGKADALHNLGRMEGGEDRPLPTFISVAYGKTEGRDSRPDVIGATEMIGYAEKCKWKRNAFNVAKPRNGEYFYIFGLVIKTEKYGYIPISTAIEPMKDGSVEVLEMLDTRTVEIKHKVARRKGSNTRATSYQQKIWDKYTFIPTVDMEDKGLTSKNNREEHTKRMFILLYNDNLRRDASTSIHASKGGIRMVFTVPVHSWKDFFKGRLTATASDGKKKRIFHHVAAHKRANGQLVPMHTRGLTRFKWNGFNIKICEWKKGRRSFLDFDLTGEVMTPEEQAEKERKYGDRFMGVDEMATRILPMFTQDLHIPTKERIH